MRKRALFIVSVLAIALLLLGGTTSALAKSHRKITGDFYFPSPPAWGVDLDIWLTLSIHEVDPSTGEARGNCNWRIYHEEWGWRELEAQLVSVAFGEHDGAPAAAFVAEITAVSGWGQGVPGEYAYFWVRDGGTPARKGDQFAINYYSLDPFYEFYPAGTPPACTYFTPFLAIDLAGGNLVIHQ
jgi:hypothetical protein